MLSKRARLTHAVIRALHVKRSLDSAEHIHATIAMRRKAGPTPPPLRMKLRYHVNEREVQGRTVYEIRPKKGPIQHHLMYQHGSAYVNPIGWLQWNFFLQLLDALNASATVPLYPLAPESYALDASRMLTRVYEEVLQNLGEKKLTLMGDSAGGNLSLSLAMQVREKNLRQPDKLLLLSPSLDMSRSDPKFHPDDHLDLILGAHGFAELTRLYARDLDVHDPLVSPIFGSLAGLAPITIFTGTHDLLNAEARRFQERAREENLSIRFIEYPEMLHDWFLFPIPEASKSIAQMLDIIRG